MLQPVQLQLVLAVFVGYGVVLVHVMLKVSQDVLFVVDVLLVFFLQFGEGQFKQLVFLIELVILQLQLGVFGLVLIE